MVWITQSAEAASGDPLQKDLLQMRILHDLDLAILSMQDEQAGAAFVLRKLADLIPNTSIATVPPAACKESLRATLASRAALPQSEPGVGLAWKV
jgi:hypothetical protein